MKIGLHKLIWLHSISLQYQWITSCMWRRTVLFLEMLERVDVHIRSWVSVSIWLYIHHWLEPSLCLQKLYGDMDEPDGVYGVASIRQAQPTVMEEILAHESLGNVQHQCKPCIFSYIAVLKCIYFALLSGLQPRQVFQRTPWDADAAFFVIE